MNGDISDYIDLMDTEPLPDELLENKETADIVRMALGQLDEKEQTTLGLVYRRSFGSRDYRTDGTYGKSCAQYSLQGKKFSPRQTRDWRVCDKQEYENETGK